MILFVNGCVRSNSRTLTLAKAVLGELSGEVREVRLYPDGPDGLDGEKLALRDALLADKAYDHPMFSWAKPGNLDARKKLSLGYLLSALPMTVSELPPWYI